MSILNKKEDSKVPSIDPSQIITAHSKAGFSTVFIQNYNSAF